MSLEEAQRIAEIARWVDGGCHHCVEDVVDRLNEAFPDFEWVMEADETMFHGQLMCHVKGVKVRQLGAEEVPGST